MKLEVVLAGRDCLRGDQTTGCGEGRGRSSQRLAVKVGAFVKVKGSRSVKLSISRVRAINPVRLRCIVASYVLRYYDL